MLPELQGTTYPAVVIATTAFVTAIALYLGGLKLSDWFEENTNRSGYGILTLYGIITLSALLTAVDYAFTHYNFTVNAFMNGMMYGLLALSITAVICVILYGAFNDFRAALNTNTTEQCPQ